MNKRIFWLRKVSFFEIWLKMAFFPLSDERSTTITTATALSNAAVNSAHWLTFE